MTTKDSELQAWRKALKERALRLLARREHSQKELADKLFNPPPSPWKQRLPTPPEELTEPERHNEVLKLVHQLEAKNLQSDARFAEDLTRQYLRKGKGPLALHQAYQEHQLDPDITQPLLRPLDNLWQQQADRVRVKRFGDQPAENKKLAAKMQRFLASRGFTAAQIAQAVFQPSSSKDQE